jgi:hypothetical protein
MGNDDEKLAAQIASELQVDRGRAVSVISMVLKALSTPSPEMGIAGAYTHSHVSSSEAEEIFLNMIEVAHRELCGGES